MPNVMVYVFLLDNITGFNNLLNETVMRNSFNTYSNFTPVLNQCNPKTTDDILRAVKKDINYKYAPTFTRNNDAISSSNDIFSEKSREIINNKLMNKDEDIYKNPIFLDKWLQAYLPTYRSENNTNLMNVTNSDKIVRSKLRFPKNAPFLVAIFETLSNVTAQTCAGTLISPRWVLTSANCINVLINLYPNDTNTTLQKSLYTIVAGATDPLSDGFAHNVTTVLQHQEIISASSTNYTGSHLALLKIDPEFEGAGLSMIDQKAEKGEVMIYGWILVKDEFGVDTLNLMTMSALILSSSECQEKNSYNEREVVCLFNNELEKNTTQLSSGGPVLMLQGGELKLLAVVQTDERVLIGYPVYAHYNWIRKILNNKDS